MNISNENLQNSQAANELQSEEIDFTVYTQPNRLERFKAFANNGDFIPLIICLIVVKCITAYFNGDGLFYYLLGFTPNQLLTTVLTVFVEAAIVYGLHLFWKYLLLGKAFQWQGITALTICVLFFAVEFYACPRGWYIKASTKIDNTKNIENDFSTKENQIKQRFEKTISLYERQIQRLETDSTSENRKRWNLVKIGRLQDSIKSTQNELDKRVEVVGKSKEKHLSINNEKTDKEGSKHSNIMIFLLILQTITSFALSYIWHNTARKKYPLGISSEQKNELQIQTIKAKNKVHGTLVDISNDFDEGLATIFMQKKQIYTVAMNQQLQANESVLQEIAKGQYIEIPPAENNMAAIKASVPLAQNRKTVGFKSDGKRPENEQDTANTASVMTHDVGTHADPKTANLKVCKYCNSPYVYSIHNQKFCCEEHKKAWHIENPKAKKR